MIDELAVTVDAAGSQTALREMAVAMQQRLAEWRELGAEVVKACQRNVQEIGVMAMDEADFAF